MARKKKERADAEVLKDARALCAAGWCRGKAREYLPAGMRYCVSGALCAVVRQGGEQYVRLMDVLWAAIPGHGHRKRKRGDLSYWNDEDRRTQADVLDAFDSAIFDAETVVPMTGRP